MKLIIESKEDTKNVKTILTSLKTILEEDVWVKDIVIVQHDSAEQEAK